MTDEKYYCRKCMNFLPENNFYKAIDNGLIDTNGKFSVCKKCIQIIYDEIFSETQSMEKTIHRMCVALNVKFSNEAMDATKTHINTLLSSGKNVNAVFSIFIMKLIATNPSMDKSIKQDLTYQDVGTIYTEKQIDVKEIPIPQDVIEFWGKDYNKNDLEYLETQYANFKQTHKADTYAEIVLLKEVCYTMLEIKKLRANQDDTDDSIKRLQSLMKNLAISPNVANAASGNKGMESFGLWIQDIEREEPAQWLSTDPRGDIYRDVANTEEYFQKYIVRPLKNFILNSKDFNVDDKEKEDEEFMMLDEGEIPNYKLVDDGEV